MSYLNESGFNTLWERLVVVLGGKADRNSVYTKAEVDYLLSTVSGGSSGGGDTSNCVHLTGNETIGGTKTFKTAAMFCSTNGTGETALYINYAPNSTSTTTSAAIKKIDSSTRTLYLPRPTASTAYMVAINGTSVTSGNLASFSDAYGSLTSTYSVCSYTNSNPTLNYNTVISSVEGSTNDSTSKVVSVATMIDYVQATVAKLVAEYGLY